MGKSTGLPESLLQNPQARIQAAANNGLAYLVPLV